MSKASMHSFVGRARSTTPMIDMCVIVPISACVYASIVSPLLLFFSAPTDSPESLSLMLQSLSLAQPNLSVRIFWPAMAAICVVLAVRNRSRIGRLTWPPHIICLLAYLAFAGASVLWAFRPELSFIRFVQEVMIVTSIVLPAMLAVRTTDMMRGLFLCFAFASILNVFFVLGNPPSLVKMENGYPGYFGGKNYLGEFSAIACLLALHEMLYPGLRRALGIVVVVIATLLLFLSNSKTAFGLALFVPLLARLTLVTGKIMRISPAIVLLSIPFCYAVLSSVSHFNMDRLSYILYGDSTLTGRTIIWEFAQYEIARRPLLGWGYQSFWLVGPDAPSIVEAPGWVKNMPNAHNGYYDTILEMGYVGLAFLVSFIIATLHAIGRVADRDPARAWLLLSLALFVILYNFLESLWMRGFEMLWVVFAILAAEIGRYWQPFPLTGAAYGSRTPRPGSPGPSRGAPGHQRRIPLNRRPIGTPDRHPKGTPSSVSND
jgi:exopolysaccharide production protein ExoQ